MDKKYDLKIHEATYVTHGDRHYTARIVEPVGTGPFPAVIEAHGGTWCIGDRMANDEMVRPIASRGVVVVSIDFRSPPDGVYPASVADLNFAVRWLKSHAHAFNSSPDRVGSMGSSSGGHLAVLNSLKPFDHRFAEIASKDGNGFDASVRYVVALWPVICPLQRHQYLEGRPSARDLGRPSAQALAYEDSYWGSSERMAEGSPLLAVERGDQVALPNMLYVQSESDRLHPQALMDRFIHAYQKKGGHIEVAKFSGEQYDDIRANPDSEEAGRIFDQIARFIRIQGEPDPRAN